MRIQVKESTTVRPLAAPPSTSLWISNVDAVFPDNIHVRCLWVYRFNGAANFFDSTVLKEALSRALVHFYPVAGRLQKDQGRIGINCNGEGVLFVEAESDGEINDLCDFVPRPELSFVPTVDYSKGISTFPLFIAQLTRFKCGGVSLGIAFEHHVSDGISALHFINTWSDMARGLDVTIPPFLDRTVLRARNPPQPRFPHIEYQPPPTMKVPLHNDATPEALIYKRFKLTRDQIHDLKVKCKEDDGNIAYSTFEVLSGHVWRCVCLARRLPEDQETRLHIAVEGRSRLQPSLPKGYFGNVLFHAYPSVLAGQLQSNQVKFSACKVREAIARMDNDYLRSALDYLEMQSDLGPISQSLHAMGCPNHAIISWVALPFYETDFGWGRPIHIGHAKMIGEGISVLFPSPTNDKSIFCAISLPKEVLDRFEKLFYDI